ncbi:unnamed protein product [Medioppia subpectinata]|uniref:Peptidase M12B domain-containing protein n=1 Tax=Medioppia subpectinata TaxID=1979941 RepID=A0A7R9KQ16_9ACAR|nr:unnamed protein product [Medioppia subpectinata]CAG2106554.1 unnamed protein product [Medioppia subpectinata]
MKHSSGYEGQEVHEIVFPRISRSENRFRRNSQRSDWFESEKKSLLLSETIVTIRAENINTTFYVLVQPNDNFILNDLSFEEWDQRKGQNTMNSNHNNCLYTGIILSPVKGRAAITRCDNSDKMYALIITESKGSFVLRPLESTYYREIKSKVKKKHTMFDPKLKNAKRTLINNKHKNNLKTYLSGDQNSTKGMADKKADREDVSEFMAHVLVRVNQSETEFCDLAFIDENDRREAFNEFIESKANNSVYNISKDIFLKRKRRAVTQKTIETAVYIDRHLLKRFNGLRSELTRLVLAIMNEVQLIYTFKSMKTRIKIVIKKMVFLSQPDNSPNTAEGDIDEYLDNFCSWQSKKWRQENGSNRWDHALMLTGLDLYKQSGDKKNKKVLGLAWVNGMCKPAYSCTLNEGKSFEAAFVIAHEMGHSLGILHDGTGNNCDGDKFIMSEKTGPANAKCLDDETISGDSEYNFQRSNRLPGEQYPPNKQCQLALGTQYRAYTSSKEPFNDICRELWCLSGSWATPAHPALEGSTCADGKKCIQGVCQSASAYVARRSIETFNQNSKKLLRHESAESQTNRLAKNSSNDSKHTKGFSRIFMDSIKGFLRSATNGAQDFFKLFTG